MTEFSSLGGARGGRYIQLTTPNEPASAVNTAMITLRSLLQLSFIGLIYNLTMYNVQFIYNLVILQFFILADFCLTQISQISQMAASQEVLAACRLCRVFSSGGTREFTMRAS